MSKAELLSVVTCLFRKTMAPDLEGAVRPDTIRIETQEGRTLVRSIIRIADCDGFPGR